jgi:Zn finger protein HypA/HybF involved in hydrogenase expression
MGSSVIAICPCGVDEQILIGGGMMNHETTCLFPCSCEKCHSLVETNILAKRPRCPKCGASNPIPYSDPRLVGDEGRGKVECWGELTLTDGTYKCPKCKKMTLRFEPGGMLWD